MTRIFVYGSLRKGLRLHPELEGALYGGTLYTAPGFRLLDLGSYPGMVRDESDGQVVGEVYWVDPETLDRLDRIEGNPNYYCRRTIALGDGSTAFAYLLRYPPEAPRVPGGDWSEYERRRRANDEEMFT